MTKQNIKKFLHITPLKALTLSIIIGISLTICIGFFTRSYYKLIEAVQNERKSYISDISKQILNNIVLNQKRSKHELTIDAKYIEAIKPKTYKELSALFPSNTPAHYMVATKKGKLVLINGNPVKLENLNLFNEILQSQNLKFNFNTLNGKRILLFSIPISEQIIEDESYNYFLMAVPIEQISRNISTSLFQKTGGIYFIETNGTINIRSNSKFAKFQGKNLFINLSYLGADRRDLYELKRNVTTNDSGTLLININSEKWLFYFKKEVNKQFVLVLAIPLTITAEETYEGFSTTIMLVIFTIILFSLLVYILSKYVQDIKRKDI